ncbi:hypothetical protein GAN17_03515 [Mycobacterium kubicae]|uniref:hypothetical protein n=1 Tax=Mycobacterium kubicae TaxID=120959 RepID=UPI00163E1F79|nr:hypothetical protein [Mycobacterium kubicae]QNI05460.1 hypothetical protein GAN17_03515 [Mycobacterium kubicae]
MLDKARRMLSYRVSVGQVITVGLALGTPYLLVGAIWSTTHTDHLHRLQGADLAVSFLGSIASWPVLLFSDVCMT